MFETPIAINSSKDLTHEALPSRDTNNSFDVKDLFVDPAKIANSTIDAIKEHPIAATGVALFGAASFIAIRGKSFGFLKTLSEGSSASAESASANGFARTIVPSSEALGRIGTPISAEARSSGTFGTPLGQIRFADNYTHVAFGKNMSIEEKAKALVAASRFKP